MSGLSSFDLSGVLSSFNIDNGIAREIALQALPDAANELRRMIQSAAGSQFTSSQASILRNVENMSVGSVTENGNGFSVDLTLGGNLSRPSLNPNNSGAYDIVGLFINGWTLSGHIPWGTWRGMKVGARTLWGGMSFLEEAIDEFNAKYASSGIHAESGY